MNFPVAGRSPPPLVHVLGENLRQILRIRQAPVALLAELRPQAFISTHFLGLAAKLEADPPDLPLVFLQVELGPDDLPTYRFVPGVAKTSLAQRTAARLGVTRDDLMALVQRAKLASRLT